MPDPTPDTLELDQPCDLSDLHGGLPWWQAEPERLRSSLELFAGVDLDRKHLWLWRQAANEADDVFHADDTDAAWALFAKERWRRYATMCALAELEPDQARVDRAVQQSQWLDPGDWD